MKILYKISSLILTFCVFCFSNSEYSETNDWLVSPTGFTAKVSEKSSTGEIVLTNGLIKRTFRIKPNAATVDFQNLKTSESIIRGVKPEAVISINGKEYKVGGLEGQIEYGYLLPEWLDSMTSGEAAFQYDSYRTGEIKERFPWKRKRYSADLLWPPPGISLTFNFVSEQPELKNIKVSVYYELYDGIPLLSKWITVQNKGNKKVRLNSFKSEVLAVVEAESPVEKPNRWRYPNIHIESDYAFHGMLPRSATKTTFYEIDPQYSSQVNYRRQTPCQLESRPPIGPEIDIEPEATFESFRTYELIYDSTDRERQGLSLRKMYRTIAPWVTENPIFMHVTDSRPDAIKKAVDQCAEVGFEMVIISFGSGLSMESEDPDYINQFRELVDYAHSKGIELGGYSLLASRRISDEHDVINPETGKTGGAIFGNSPCLESEWGIKYFEKLTGFFEKTGFDMLEHDGSYPGDVCASTEHPGHKGLDDSQWRQWKKIIGFYKWCRARGIFLNVPDWYFLNGSNKTGMGYREVNWSLPRDRQIILGRQNIFDGTRQKTPSMGWMFVPLVQYHGGGAAATLEPLSEHLEAYEAHLVQNFGSGVQACYRGPRLYDTEETKTLVKKWVDFYKKYRDILNSDIIHVRRPDGRDIDCILHVNPALEEKGLAMVYNPLNRTVNKSVTLPLYYTGITEKAKIREQEGEPGTYKLNRKYEVELPVELAPKSFTWYVIE
ncbi:alpha-galactosidase [candidate division KSB1 bacterium]